MKSRPILLISVVVIVLVAAVIWRSASPSVQPDIALTPDGKAFMNRRFLQARDARNWHVTYGKIKIVYEKDEDEAADDAFYTFANTRKNSKHSSQSTSRAYSMQQQHDKATVRQVPSDSTLFLPVADLSRLTRDISRLGEMLNCSWRLKDGMYWKQQQQQQGTASSSSSSVSSSLALAMQQRHQQQNQPQEQQKQQQARRSGSCSPIPGWNSELLPFESSKDELSCEPLTTEPLEWRFYEFRRKSSDEFDEEKEAESTLDRFAGQLQSQQQLSLLARKILRRYSRFIFYSSWMFSQFLPWAPLPVSTVSVIANGGYDTMKKNQQKRKSEVTTAAVKNSKHAAATKEDGEAAEKEEDQHREEQAQRENRGHPIQFRAYHDRSLDDLYHVENFCLSPFGHISGFGAGGSGFFFAQTKIIIGNAAGDGDHGTILTKKNSNMTKKQLKLQMQLQHEEAPYFPLVHHFDGKNDERGMYHGAHNVLRRFFDRATMRPTVPRTFDERPVIFIGVDHFTRYNIGHLALRQLSLVAIHATIVERWTQNNKINGNDNSSSSATVKPLFVFVFEQHPDEKQRANDFVKVNAWGFIFRLFDTPWAAVTAEQYSLSYTRRLFQMTKHSGFSSSSSSSSSPFTIKNANVCYLRGVALQSCFRESCGSSPITAQRPSHEEDSYPDYVFTNWAQVTYSRRATMNRLGALYDRCLFRRLRQAASERKEFSSSAIESNDNQPPTTTLAAAAASATPYSTSLSSMLALPHRKHKKPRVFFDLRSEHRIIRHIGLLMDQLRSALKDFVSDIVFREVGRGSRAKYLRDDLASADIFVGVHGGSFAQVSHFMPRGGVVVELSEPFFWCAPPKGRKSCWYDLFTEYNSLDHWIVRLPQSSVAERNQAFLRAQKEEAVAKGRQLSAKNAAESSKAKSDTQQQQQQGTKEEEEPGEEQQNPEEQHQQHRRNYQRNSFPVSPSSLIALIKQAACRWAFRRTTAATTEGTSSSSSSSSLSSELQDLVNKRCLVPASENPALQSPLQKIPRGPEREVFAEMLPIGQDASSSSADYLQQAFTPGGFSSTAAQRVLQKLGPFRRILVNNNIEAAHEHLFFASDVPSLWQPLVSLFVGSAAEVRHESVFIASSRKPKQVLACFELQQQQKQQQQQQRFARVLAAAVDDDTDETEPKSKQSLEDELNNNGNNQQQQQGSSMREASRCLVRF